jgi:hypothetical protein
VLVLPLLLLLLLTLCRCCCCWLLSCWYCCRHLLHLLLHLVDTCTHDQTGNMMYCSYTHAKSKLN